MQPGYSTDLALQLLYLFDTGAPQGAPFFQMKTPACFDSKQQYILWHEAAKESVRGKRVKKWLICEDCTPEYKAKMLDAGRCGNPGYVVTNAIPSR